VRFTLSDERTAIAKAEPLRHALAARTVIETGRAPARGTCWPSIETPERDVRYGLWARRIAACTGRFVRSKAERALSQAIAVVSQRR
jgi:hypothetical protein